MMSRKYTTILTTMIISLFAVGAALAQESGDGDTDRNHDGDRRNGMSHRGQRGFMDPERAISMMTRRLELDDTQTEQVRNIYMAAKPEFDSLRETGRANRMAMRDLNSEDADYELTRQGLSAEREGISAAAKELRDRIRSEIDAVLTPEQRDELAAMAERGRDRGQRHRNRDEAKPEA